MLPLRSFASGLSKDRRRVSKVFAGCVGALRESPSVGLPVNWGGAIRPMGPSFIRHITNSSDSSPKSDPPKLPDGLLMCYGMPYKFHQGDLSSIETHLTQNPVFAKVQPGRLILPKAKDQYMAKEGGRSFMQMGLLLCNACHVRKIDTNGLFVDDNLDVLSKLGCLAFRDVPPPQADEISDIVKRENLSQAITYLRKKAIEFSSMAESDIPGDWNHFFKMPLDPSFDIDECLTHSVFWLKEERGLLVNRIFRKLREILVYEIINSTTHFGKLQHLNDKAEHLRRNNSTPGIDKVYRILDNLPYTSTMAGSIPNSSANLWTTRASDRYSVVYAWARPKLISVPSGRGLLDLHRHGQAHSMEEDFIIHLRTIAAALNITIADPTYHDVIDLFHSEFEDFLHEAVHRCRVEGVDLDLWSLCKLPLSLT